VLNSEVRLQNEECINIPEETFGEGDGYSSSLPSRLLRSIALPTNRASISVIRDEWRPIVSDLLLPELDTVKNYLLWPVYREGRHTLRATECLSIASDGCL
jgi:hypothetical protein